VQIKAKDAKKPKVFQSRDFSIYAPFNFKGETLAIDIFGADLWSIQISQARISQPRHLAKRTQKLVKPNSASAPRKKLILPKTIPPVMRGRSS
jgi:hypothetical protein